MIGYLGDFDLAEDVVQEAFAAAAERWPRDGQPRNPGAWLVTAARHRAIDRIRRDRTLTRKLALLAETPQNNEQEQSVTEASIPDERLELIFTCCHPALAREAQVALTLRAVGGLGTEDIAHAFLVSAETMKRRLTRAKTRIKEVGIPFRVPPAELLPDRLAAVLAVVYLIYNEGYAGRVDLASEAIRLGHVLTRLMPGEPEVQGLLALMLCHDARRRARYASDELVLLEAQDRTLWDHAQIEEGRALVEGAFGMGGRGPYVLQAAIAVLQTEPTLDWPQIAALYAELAERTRSPVVQLNRAVAIAQAGSPDVALALVDRLELAEYPYFHSTRAELLRRLDRVEEARNAYRRALELIRSEPERRFLERRLFDLS
ncbi:MAG: sigma-70 family RNA polymerase sigma factor [Chloroflexi bacterium]|nr:sigma-70 family RNA polymerase sigma factor [Chloroflexota bacterium]